MLRGAASSPTVSTGTSESPRHERAVAAAAGVVAAAEVGELDALRRRDEQLAGVRVRERGPARARAPFGMVEDRRVAARAEAVGVAGEAQLLAVAPRDRLVALAEERDLDVGVAVEPLRELARVDGGAGQEVDHGRRGSTR